MNYDDWLFEQDWNAATSGGLTSIDTGQAPSYSDWAASGGYTPQDLYESISYAVDPSSDYVSSFADVTFGSDQWSSLVNEGASTRMARQGLTVESGGTQSEGGILGRVSDWMNKNKELTKVLAGAVAGVANASSKKEDRKSAMDQINRQDELRREAAARYSESITGLRVPERKAQTPLKRVNGSQVFTGNGLLGS